MLSRNVSVLRSTLKGNYMSILKNFSIILMGLAATVCQAEIAIEVPPPEEQLEHPAASSGATPSESELKVAPLRLALDLVDGSRIIGVPSITSVSVQTSYAKMDIPLEKIVSIEIKDDHETASFELQNGDKLKGVLSLAPLELETLFGKVSVGVEHIVSLEVAVSGAGVPAGLHRKLILHYSFDKDDGDNISDKSGMKNNAEVKGAKWTRKGKLSGAFEFDGVDDYIRAGDLGGMPEKGTIAFWMNPAELANYRNPFTTKRGGGNAGFRFEENAAGRFCLVAGDDGGTAAVHAYTEILKARRWYHIVLIWDRESGNIKGYLDGSLAFDEPHKHWATRFHNVAIGTGFSTSAKRQWKGEIDEVTIWSRALSKNEIKPLYSSQK
jgi:hypothetical protein